MTSRREWTDEEDATIVALYSRQQLGYIAKLLGVDYCSLQTRIAKLQKAGRVDVLTRNYHPRWTQDADAELRGRSGWQSTTSIAIAMKRTVNAIRVRQKRLGLSLSWKGAYSARGVGRIFEVDAKTVVIWIERGYLKGEKSGVGAGAHLRWRVDHEAIEAFIADFPERYERRRILIGSYWRELADKATRRHEDMVTVDQAALLLDVCAATIVRHIQRGWLPGERIHWAGGFIWRVPRAALASFAKRHVSWGPGRVQMVVTVPVSRTAPHDPYTAPSVRAYGARNA